MGVIRRAEAVATFACGDVIAVMVVITAVLGAIVTTITAFDGLESFAGLARAAVVPISARHRPMPIGQER